MTIADIEEIFSSTDLIEEFGIPPETMMGIIFWMSHGLPQGSFLEAVFSNDLKDAINRADDRNLAAIGGIVKFLHNRVDHRSWGSRETVEEWGDEGGLIGIYGGSEGIEMMARLLGTDREKGGEKISGSDGA